MDKKQQILDTAAVLFSRHGFEKTSASLLAKEANTAQGTIFYHFGTMRNVLVELIKRESERFHSTLEKELDGIASVKEMLTVHLRNILTQAVSNPQICLFFKEATSNASETKDPVAILRDQMVLQKQEFLKNLLDTAAEKNELKANTDTKLASTALYIAFSGAMKATFYNPDQIEDNAQAVIQFVINPMFQGQP